ncbi:MAG: hypothetical protein ACRYGR_09905 [Janthinobacterium lividum]
MFDWLKRAVTTPADPDDVEHVGHTIIHTDEAGVTHTQRLGREHEVAGSETIIDVPVGTRIVIRHVV